MKKIETFNELIKVDLPGGSIDPQGILTLNNTLYKYQLPSYHIDDLRWVTKAGTLPKRLAKWLRTQRIVQDKKSIDRICAHVGSLLSAYIIKKPTEVYVDFTKTIDWCPGDFSDHGSCYWGTETRSRAALVKSNCIAIRTWVKKTDEDFLKQDYTQHSYSGFRGQARAWLLERPEGYILFNGYDGTGKNSTILARILSTFLEGNYHQITITKNNVYVNVNSIYLIHNYGDTPPKLNFDIIATITDEDYAIMSDQYHLKHLVTQCKVCKDDYLKSQIKLLSEAPPSLNSVNWEHLFGNLQAACTKCLSKVLLVCEICKQLNLYTNITKVTPDISCCKACFQTQFVICPQCYQYKRKKDSNNTCRYCKEIKFVEDIKNAIHTLEFSNSLDSSSSICHIRHVTLEEEEENP